MTRSLSIALSLMSVVASSSTVLGQNEVREAIDEAVQEAVDAVEDNYAKFVDANASPIETARQSLNALVGTLNADKKFAEATKVQSILVDLEKIVMQRAVPVTFGSKPKPQPVPAPPLPPQKPLLERMVGKWHRDGGTDYVLKTDGTIEQWGTIEKRISNKGRYQLGADGTVEALWATGHRWQCRFAGDDWIAIYETHNGNAVGDGIVLERVK